MVSPYPRIRDTQRLSQRSQAKCVVCGVRAHYRADVQVDHFRGNDVVAKVCKAHVAMPAAVLDAAERPV